MSGSYFTNDPRHLAPESAFLSVDACAFSGGADVLAGKASRNDVNTSSPRLSVKGCDVIPDGKRFQASVVLSRHKYACGVGVEFDCTDSSPSEELASEYASTSACEKSQLIHKSSRRTVGAFSRR